MIPVLHELTEIILKVGIVCCFILFQIKIEKKKIDRLNIQFHQQLKHKNFRKLW